MKRNVLICIYHDGKYVGHRGVPVDCPHEAQIFDDEDDIAAIAAVDGWDYDWTTLVRCVHYTKAEVIVPFRPGGGNRAEREELFAQLPAPIRATCHAQTSGTTAQSWDLDVLYYGRHVALIHHRGCSYSASGGQRYASGWVERVRIGRTALCSYSGYQCDRTEKVHDGEDGRLTEAHLATLIRDAREYDAQYPALREAEQAQITAREERIAEVQQAQTAYWEAVAQQAEAVGGKAIISTFGDDPVLSKHYHLNCAELVESKGRVEIGPLIVHMHARYEVASGKGGEWEVTRVDVKPDAIPSSDPLALLAALPALSFLNAR